MLDDIMRRIENGTYDNPVLEQKLILLSERPKATKDPAIDEIVIPDAIGKAHPKGAITLRNKWMVETCDLIICYIEREEGGAYTAVRYAERGKKEIINISKGT